VEGLEEVQVKDPEEAQAEVLVEEPVEEEEQERVPAGTAYVLHVVHKYRTGRDPCTSMSCPKCGARMSR